MTILPKKERAGMVNWFSPIQLAQTGYEAAISTIFGKHADNRLLEAALNPDPNSSFIDLTSRYADGDDIWIDYIADVGDGFNSTYAVAYYASQDTLKFGKEETKRGDILVFGGDEIYPAADPDLYEQRLKRPYEMAFPREPNKSSPLVFAIPGNHDWYDSLVAFKEIFIKRKDQFSRTFAGRLAIQNRSYFAVKLSRGWWLFGTDLQLGSKLDEPQIDYFKGVMKCVKQDPDARIILCSAEPYWLYVSNIEKERKLRKRGTSTGDTRSEAQKQMDHFQGEVLDGRVAAYIAGDLHHFRHHTNKARHKHKFVAGGGGAFLHPTHKHKVSEIGINSVYKLERSYPEETVSTRLCWKNLTFWPKNWSFGFVTALLYLIVTMSFGEAFPSNFDILQALVVVGKGLVSSGFVPFSILILFLAALFFTDKSTSPFQRVACALVHTATHLILLFVAALVFTNMTALDGTSYTAPRALGFGGLITLTGYFGGSFILGCYLLVTMNCFGWNANEAFASLKIEDYKNFLRLKISPNSDITVYPIKIERVPRKWKEGKETLSKLVPDDTAASTPELIKPPIKIVRKLVEKGTGRAASRGVAPDDVVVKLDCDS